MQLNGLKFSDVHTKQELLNFTSSCIGIEFHSLLDFVDKAGGVFLNWTQHDSHFIRSHRLSVFRDTEHLRTLEK